jgi:hypothetical protein
MLDKLGGAFVSLFSNVLFSEIFILSHIVIEFLTVLCFSILYIVGPQAIIWAPQGQGMPTSDPDP